MRVAPQGAGVTVATVSYIPCSGLSVAGTATYKDYPSHDAQKPREHTLLPYHRVDCVDR